MLVNYNKFKINLKESKFQKYENFIFHNATRKLILSHLNIF